ncbi:hypothetical protein BDA99DRAFT_562958 [Phascolomyces articulosus]|uniref:Homeobox domain-containing protein n=1 Tax=Phascolomyces articulosus TaxID=60185 RepID=A0AAD5JTJ5_9FUNG|nr:hypothetical protein BDA99DRAFT_562958 [Phascolomyces articulosus]
MLSTTTTNANGFVNGTTMDIGPTTCHDEQQQQYTPPLPSACYCADCYSSSSSTCSIQDDTCSLMENASGPIVTGGEIGIIGEGVDGMSGTTGGWCLAPNPVSCSSSHPTSSSCSGSLIDPAYTMTNAKASNHSPYQQQPQVICDCCYPPTAMTNEEFKPAFYNPFEVKHRRRTSRAQFKVLEKTFHENPKPNAHKRRSLAQKLGMTPRGVQVWFQNRRAKAKAQQRREQQQQMTSPSSSTTPSLSTTTHLPMMVDTSMVSSSTVAPPMQRQHSNASSSYSVEPLTTPITPMDMFSFLDQQQQVPSYPQSFGLDHSEGEKEEEMMMAGKWDLVPGLMYSSSETELMNHPSTNKMVTLDRVTETDTTNTTATAAFTALFDPYFGDLKRTSYPSTITQQQQPMMINTQQLDFNEATRRLSEPIYNNADLDLNWVNPTPPTTTFNGFA